MGFLDVEGQELGAIAVGPMQGVQPLDFWTFALVTFVIAVTAVVSIAGPAWRAVRIDPAAVLRAK